MTIVEKLREAAYRNPAHSLYPEAAALLERAAGVLSKCSELFYEIRMDWSDPREECREGMAIARALLTDITTGDGR
jgi:hypothetical protein